jgi:hypothetical protein
MVSLCHFILISTKERFHCIILLVRKDMDVNEHERLANIKLKHKLSKGTTLLLLFYTLQSQ